MRGQGRLSPFRLLLALACAAGIPVAASVCGRSSPPVNQPPATPVCGDRVVQTGEECDDGNADDGDSCLSTCLSQAVWAEGEPHIHGHGCGGTQDPSDLVEILRANGLNVGSALIWGHAYEADAGHFSGRDDPSSLPQHLLHYDLETSALGPSRPGHLLLLGVESLAYSPDIFRTPETGVPVVDWALAQPGVAVGMAHGQFWPGGGGFPDFPVRGCCLPPDDCCVPWELPVHAARGKLHFLESEVASATTAVDDGTFLLWKSLQNSGFRVTLAGGSDLPCRDIAYGARTPRTAFLLDGDLSYDKWLQALREGRAIATLPGGDRLNLRIRGVKLGGEVAASAGEPLSVAIDGRFPRAEQVEILANGARVASVAVGPGMQAARVEISLGSSAWVVARSPYSVTNPVYVILGGRPIRASPSDACYFVRYIDHLSDLVTSGKLSLGAGDQAVALPAYAAAREILMQRFAEAGGQHCP